MVIHSASDPRPRTTLCGDYFYNYFTRGLDILFDGQVFRINAPLTPINKKVKEPSLHSTYIFVSICFSCLLVKKALDLSFWLLFIYNHCTPGIDIGGQNFSERFFGFADS